MKKQSNGMYKTKVKIGVDENGKAINKWIQARTVRELDKKRDEIIAIYVTGERTAADVMFNAYVRTWFETYKKPHVSRSTVMAYNLLINNYITPYFACKNVRAITATDVQQFMNSMQGLSRSMITLARTILNGTFKAAMRDRLTTVNPMQYISNPKAAEVKEKHVLTVEERARLEACATDHEHGLLLAMLYYTGMRMGECCALQWGDIDFKAKTIHIQRSQHHYGVGDLKTKSSDRIVPITPKLMQIINKYPHGLPNVYIFQSKGTAISIQQCYVIWGKLLYSCGLAHKREDTRIETDFPPHAIRHNFITMCYESGIDAFTACKLAGHSSIQVTMNIYTHLSKDHIQTVATKVAQMFQ